MTLGAVAAALVAHAVGKAGDKVGEGAVDAGAGAVHRLVGWLRDRFAGDDEAANALVKVQDAPDSPARLRMLAEVVDRHAQDDTFRGELAALVAEAKTAGVDVGSVTQTVWGDQNVQSAGLSDSSVTVTYGQPPPRT